MFYNNFGFEPFFFTFLSVLGCEISAKGQIQIQYVLVLPMEGHLGPNGIK